MLNLKRSVGVITRSTAHVSLVKPPVFQCIRFNSGGNTSDTTVAGKKPAAKLWGGRFSGETDPLMERFNASISVDKRMWREDLEGSMAYSKALNRCGLLTQEENEKMQKGLKLVFAEWESGKFVIVNGTDEDIHTANERRLTELIGAEVAGKLHTGRSRNDQCVTDFKLWLKNNIPVIIGKLDAVVDTIVTRFERNPEELDVIFSGYTHLQQAQLVRWAHYLCAYGFMLKSDAMKLRSTMAFLDSCPLGSGAIAGHSFFKPDDRRKLAADLGFATVTDNSMDAVSNRDYVLDFLYNSSLIAVHLSRFHEDMIIYNSQEFGMVEMSDLYSTGSSLMPQKKNPDACEIVRGKSGEVIGNMVGFFVTMKGLPSTYNKDLQDDKMTTFRVFDTVSDCLDITQRVIETLKMKKSKFQVGKDDNLFATDVADYLVRKGVPFRSTHHIAGSAVRLSEKTKKPLSQLNLDDWKSLHPLFEADIKNLFDPVYSVEHKNAEGSTSLRGVKEQLAKLKRYVQENKQI